MHWLIVEDALRDRKGHWFEYVSTFVRGLRALGDEVEVLCDRKAERFILESMGARAVLPESIWHRMGDGTGALKRYARVPLHAMATFFALRRVFRSFDHRGHREHRGASAEKKEINHEIARKEEAAQRLASQAGAAFSNPSSSKLPRDCEITSLNRSAMASASLPATTYTLPVTSSPPDWIFVPTVLVHHLLGWWMLLKTGSVPKGARVLLFFPNLPIRLDDTGRPRWAGGPTTKLMAWLFGQLRKDVECGRLVLGVETHAMRRALEGLIQMPVVYMPHPVEAKSGRPGARVKGTELTTDVTDKHGLGNHERHEIARNHEAGPCLDKPSGAAFSNPSTSELARDSENTSLTRFARGPAPLPDTSYTLLATSAKPIVFGCYGAARWEKGSDIFQEAIKRILKNEVASDGCRVTSAQNQSATGLSEPVTNYSLPATAASRPLRFAIQWVEDFRDGEGRLITIDPWLLEHPQVEVIGRYFQGDEYERRLAATDVMVLPYRSPYRLRVSRVVIEAMINGMPVIATRGTTLFEQAEEHAVVVGCEEGNAESLAEAILEVAGSFETMKARAKEKAKSAAEKFAVAHFRELLEQ